MSDAEGVDWDELAKWLRLPEMPSQSEIARQIGCDQPFVWRARNRELKRVTERVEKLWNYAAMRAAAIGPQAPSVQRGKASNPAATIRSKRPEARAAMTRVRAYLRDGFDAQVLADQIDVLRRAQRVQPEKMEADGHASR